MILVGMIPVIIPVMIMVAKILGDNTSDGATVL